jgi:hypothetical protein
VEKGREVSPLPVISKQTFTRQFIKLDGRRFENCRFIECQIVYSGGPVEISSCEFSPDTVWQFQGYAGMTMQVLQQCGWRIEFGKQGPLASPVPIVPGGNS